ncbi:2OG-Fe(II) oxygenase [Parvularcula flava]|uniref:2OG-Fe(II) oxygenase n=1 Tax=Aquisalinus luteolus TaxID=1566827 RepID=A0A8J3A2X2_9PROT|nr:2OG-Fe(II) oxygenase [Aquisalinus luteolus]NHK28621.1 2OG-Fe(II) oxygenase [Aquisalinus luteolus]GGH99027.1 hypothetical protein GCM10011355_24010 [Aquisalinus luteolus]
MKLWRKFWRRGRQEGGYEKIMLFGCPWIVKFDVYLIRYLTGDHIPPHNDPAPDGWEHHRFNMVLRDCEEGGKFQCQNFRSGRFLGKRWIRFRPDIETHSVSEVTKGTRYIFSVGWLRKSKTSA